MRPGSASRRTLEVERPSGQQDKERKPRVNDSNDSNDSNDNDQQQARMQTSFTKKISNDERVIQNGQPNGSILLTGKLKSWPKTRLLGAMYLNP
jgi:hypothetical protein